MELFQSKALQKTIFLFIFFSSKITLAQPTITAIKPSAGTIETRVTIKGTGFSASPDSNIVFFGPVKAKVVAASDSLLRVRVPAGATYESIGVTRNGLTGFSQQSFLITFAGSSVMTPTSFAPKADFSTGSYPREMAVNDFDFDGKPDIAVVNGNGNSISIFKNTSTAGNISFMSKLDHPAGNNPFNIASADFDGDGKVDLAVANYDDNTVAVYKNVSRKGIILFSPPVNFATANSPEYITVDDFDGDGKIDIAIVNNNSNSISVLRNTSPVNTIRFASKIDFATGNWPHGICSGDLTGDGSADIAVANYNDSTVSILKNISTRGNISFLSKVDYKTGSGPWHPVISDVSGDQKPEIIVANSSSNTLSIFKNLSRNNKIIFDVKKDYATADLPLNISVGDIDGDGKPDIAVTDFSIFSNTVSVFKNIATTGDISFDSKIDFMTANSPRGILLDDFDADGKPDIIVSNSNSNSLSVLRNQVPLNAFALMESSLSKKTITGKIENQIHPNPSNGNFLMQIQLPPQKLQTMIALYNSVGKKVWQEEAGKTGGMISKHINLENILSPGLHFIRIERSDTSFEVRVMIMKR